ncbi:hypothetical protein JCM19037_466 [Geomicrobium sp. JCM 19037]|uniref:hypothetical protein n=1 Tax=Geomicrobium sp. JCM 19037 TaxID=1460634 RepID=UPI00045F1F05|nr:hypothetical protein [Geomicrobium sp. JCM 19037]GAK02246.1 hypothetical protein JCM19037_466 [Geomicrobium sp. JCM 19037]
MNEKKDGYLNLLKRRNFLLFTIAQVTTNLGDGIHMTAVTFLAIYLGLRLLKSV